MGVVHDARATPSLEAHAIRERVDKRMSVLGEQLWGDGRGQCGSAPAASTTSCTSARRRAPETSIVYGLVEE